MKKAVVFGYGNVGKAVINALNDTEDLKLAGIVSRSCAGRTIDGVPVVADDKELGVYDVAILALPSREVPAKAAELLNRGIPTADSFDIHGEIPALRKSLDAAAKKGGAAAVISAGWDPGSDSVIRTMMLAMAPRGISYTNFGPGMSMGHSVAVKAIDGVKDSLSMTIPMGQGIHRRMVYVELEDGADFDAVAKAIKADAYFVHDETHVQAVPSVRALKDMGHGVHLERKGVSGTANNQYFSFDMKIDNPALTGQILVCAARAALRSQPGCYTMIEIPTVDFLEMDRDEAVKLLV